MQALSNLKTTYKRIAEEEENAAKFDNWNLSKSEWCP